MPGLKDACKLYYGTDNIYEVLNIKRDASGEEVKKAYRKLSLLVHPDRVTEEQKEEATEKFKVLGKIHSILNDSEKRAIYDESGCLDDLETSELEEKDWYDYWRLLFKRVTVEDIDAYEAEYKGSETELEDLKSAYEKGRGDMDKILSRVPFTTPEDEPRLREILEKLIADGELSRYDAFTTEDSNKKKKRQKKYEKEAKRATRAVKELKNKNGKRKLNGEEDYDEVDVSTDALKSIKLKMKDREAKADNFFKSLEEKYGSAKGNKKTSSSKAK